MKNTIKLIGIIAIIAIISLVTLGCGDDDAKENKANFKVINQSEKTITGIEVRGFIEKGNLNIENGQSQTFTFGIDDNDWVTASVEVTFQDDTNVYGSTLKFEKDKTLNLYIKSDSIDLEP